MDVKKIVGEMTLHEKLMQLTQLNASFFLESGAAATGPLSELGLEASDLVGIGSALNFWGQDKAEKIQKDHLDGDRNKIPMMFMMDVVHGSDTIYPIPLAMGATFSPETMRKCCAMAARESLADGIDATFGPMVDLARDARWGRVAETTGEDPYLNCVMAKAQVEGFHDGGLATCVKHYAAYGAAEAGRDYNTVDMSERTLREYYLPSYKAAVDAGTDMVMTSFNVLDGMPSSGNEKLVKGILRDEWGFDGVVISDYNAFGELVTHGVAEDMKEAALLAITASSDVEMMSSSYLKNMEKLISEGKVKIEQIDKAVERFLKLKENRGVFGKRELPDRSVVLSPEHRRIALEAAEKCAVLLKNDGVLPFDKSVKKVAVIGPFGDTGAILGCWHCYGKASEAVTVKQGVKNLLPHAIVEYAEGVSGELDAVASADEIKKAADLAAKSDIVILTLGEPEGDSGEGNSKLNIELPAAQYELLDAVIKANKNTAVILFNGRPLAIPRLIETAPAVLDMWQAGTETGNALARLAFGDVAPEGRLPMTFPAATGQCPIYYNRYNTGRPSYYNTHRVGYCSSYIDGPTRPLFPFGYGLSYTEFGYSDLKASAEKLAPNGEIVVSAKIKNIGKRAATETVQLYIRDVVGSVVRPVRELKGFKKVTLAPDEETTVSFTIKEDDLAFYNASLVRAAETGEFHAFIGKNAECEDYVSFRFEK